jgi:hypothetical protein
VWGEIEVMNSTPIDAVIVSVSDMIMPDMVAADVDCKVTFPYLLEAGEKLTCTYSKGMSSATANLNKATVERQNFAYDWEMNATENGTTQLFATAPIIFNMDEADETDECVTVYDDFGEPGDWEMIGGACRGTVTFEYPVTFGPYETCGIWDHINTAKFVTNDTQTSGEDWWKVVINVPCPGCTLTIGYWKTHAGFGPQPDMVTQFLPIWLGNPPVPPAVNKSLSITTNQVAVDVLNMKTYGTPSNGITKLYAQLLAAKLNIANGADPTPVASTIAAADKFLAKKDWKNWSSLTSAKKTMVNRWAATLDKYNNGLLGVMHCSQ